jgi:hypothetical protein
MAFIPTVLTPKLSLRRAITALNVSTLAAFLRGVAIDAPIPPNPQGDWVSRRIR